MIWFAKATPPLRSTFRSSKILSASTKRDAKCIFPHHRRFACTTACWSKPRSSSRKDNRRKRNSTDEVVPGRTRDWFDWKKHQSGGFFGDVVQNSFFNHEHIGILSYEIYGNRTDEWQYESMWMIVGWWLAQGLSDPWWGLIVWESRSRTQPVERNDSVFFSLPRQWSCSASNRRGTTTRSILITLW